MTERAYAPAVTVRVALMRKGGCGTDRLRGQAAERQRGRRFVNFAI